MVVRSDTDKTLKLETDAFVALKHLEDGLTLKEVSKILGRSHTEVMNLTNELIDSGFVKSIDGNPVPDSFPTIKPFKFFLKQEQLRFLYSKFFWVAVLVLICMGFSVAITTPELAPSYRQYFWSENLLVVYISLFILGTFFVFLHEFVHFLVTIAVGGQARVRISNRFLDIVAETESYHLALVDKPKRYLVYLSGMALNLSIISIMYLFLKISMYSFALDHTVQLLLQAIVLINIQSVIWQYNLLFQTDIYNFISDYLESDNLHNNTMLYLLNTIKKWGG